MPITIRELLTKWGFKSDTAGVENFQKKLDGARHMAGIAAKGMAVLGGAAVAAGYGIFRLTKNVAEQSHEIERARMKTGLSAESLQQLQFAAKRTQTPFEAVVVGMKKVAMMAQKAAHGNKEAKQAFNDLEVDAIDPTTKKMKSMGDIAMESVFALGDVKDETLQLTLAQKFFGRGGTEMLTLLKEGRVGLAQMMFEAKKSMLKDKDLEAGVKLNKSLLLLDATWGRLKKRLGIAFLPLVQGIADKMEKWVSANSKIIAQEIPAFVDKLVKAFKELFGGVDVQGFMTKLTSGLKWVLEAIRSVMEYTTALKWAFGALIGLSVASKLLPIVGVLTKMAGGLGAVNVASVAAKGGISGIISSLGGAGGLIAMAAAAGYGLGKLADKYFGLSDKISDQLVQTQQLAARVRVEKHIGADKVLRLKEMVDQFVSLSAKGVENFTDRSGMTKQINMVNVEAKLKETATNLGVSKEDQAALIPNLLKGFGNQTTNNISPTINVNMPPGASKSDYEKAADVMNKKLQRTLTDLTPGGA